ncbi:hypothetical protein [Paraburkholderia sp. UCT2]|uniref:hypothetical protein n=1 Tax=Paraburkholderia sp. UCT2 TaxID=2615208 RepID=UPI00165510AC|nr:hypothetical protein [Paraburkholderia sp. UCT2]MBC8726818.1 hypothetical protein [Paraburkholderia sp. UCT2]
MNYDFARKALEPWWRKASHDVDPRSLENGLRDILSLEKAPPVSDEEMQIFGMLYAIMIRENRKWLSISQVAYPHEKLINGNRDEASLKSRIGVTIATSRETTPPVEIIEPMQLRRRFLDLVSLCVPREERERYPHILNLVDSHVVNTKKAPSPQSSGVDCAAWCLANYFSEGMRLERGAAAFPHPVTPDMSTEEVRAAHEKTIARLQSAIDAHAWRVKIRDTPASDDSLFSRILVHAAVNRHCLETWAYEKRLMEVLPMLQRIFGEVSEVVRDGLSRAVQQVSAEGQVDYAALAELTLARTFTEKGKPLTAGVQERIGEQVDALLASARDEFFEDESQLNEFLVGYPARARALLWIVLAWCYQHGSWIPNEDPRIKRKNNTVVSTRSKLITASQDMSTLRRLLMTSVFSRQWEKPDADRLTLHAHLNSAIRALARSSLERSFKGASLAQLDAFVSNLDRRRYIELVKEAEVGTLLHAVAS